MLSVVITGAAIVFSILAHELAHGYAASWHGDDTARRAGRLTWNPVAHVHPVLSVFLPCVSWLLTGGHVIVGGARPIPVNPFNYTGRRDRADVFVSLAGVCANACIVVACLAVVAVTGSSIVTTRVIAANVAVIVFNLLPIAPLDGWRVLECVRRARRRRRARGL
jgi:Zn-dependent protease